jgi:glutamyl-tRNA synthetase
MNKKNIKVRTRFAPSPTGTPESIHLGFVIRALWNYAYAKKHKGQFILRIEDTDQKRSRKDVEVEILKVLKKFGISWDEGPDIGGPHSPYRQSERLNHYQKAAHLLVERGFAYYDFDAKVREKDAIKDAYNSKEKLTELKKRPIARSIPVEEAKKRVEMGEVYVVRVKIPEDKKFSYTDWILKKKIEFLGKEVPDLILLKSDGFPTYHLAVVVDDIEMQISHVFRGQEWISSTPIHLHVYEGLKHDLPEIGHFSVILDPRTAKKFSKRDMSAMFGVDNWLTKGYLPEALLNYLMLLGWAPKDNREIFSLNEFVEVFDQEGLQKANPTFDTAKLEWMNSQYIMKLNDDELVEKIHEYFKGKYNREKLIEIAPLIKSRIKTLVEFEELAGFLFDEPKVDKELFKEEYRDHLNLAIKVIEDLKGWKIENLNDNLMKMIGEKGFKVGDFFMSLRVAITGTKFTPPINESMIILGKEETLKRLKKVL